MDGTEKGASPAWGSLRMRMPESSAQTESAQTESAQTGSAQTESAQTESQGPSAVHAPDAPAASAPTTPEPALEAAAPSFWAPVLQQSLSSLLVLTVVGLGLLRPPHLDEESYLFIGRALSEHLFRPYDWSRPWPPDFLPHPNTFWYAHPPLFLQWQALLQLLWGDALWPKRLSALPYVLMSVFALHRLSQQFLRDATRGLLWLVAAPSFLLVCTNALMIDLPMMGCALLALTLAWDGAERRSTSRLVLSGALLGVAGLIKYPALLLLPLGWFLPVPPRERMRTLALISAPALLLALGWQGLSAWLYGTPHLLEVLRQAPGVPRSSLLSRLVGMQAQLGVGVVSACLVLAVRGKPSAPPSPARPWLAWSLSAVLPLLVLTGVGVKQGWLAPGGLLSASLPASLQTFAERWTERLVDRLPTSAGLTFWLLVSLLLGGWSLQQLSFRSRDERFLSLWTLLIVLGVLFGHNFVSARYLVLASMPLTLLALRRAERAPGLDAERQPVSPSSSAIPELLASGLALALVWGDHAVAVSLDALAARSLKAAQTEAFVQKTLSSHPSTVYFTGEWGLRWQFERAGLPYLSPDRSPKPGDILLVPRYTVSGPLPEGLVWQTARSSTVEVSGLLVHAPGVGISIYSDAMGLVPWGFGLEPQSIEELDVRVLQDPPQ